MEKLKPGQKIEVFEAVTDGGYDEIEASHHYVGKKTKHGVEILPKGFFEDNNWLYMGASPMSHFGIEAKRCGYYLRIKTVK
jgi:hypothetical protein